MSVFGSDGIWYQWTSPTAVQDSGKTFAGWVTRKGAIVAASLDHITGKIGQHSVAANFNADDHAAPALIVRQSDKRILFFYTKHNDKILRWRISQYPLDIRSWGPEQTYTTERNCAYPQIAQLSAENGRIYVFFRHAIVGGDQRDWAFLVSNDEGKTFGDFRTLRKNFYAHGNGVLNPYTVVWSDGVSRIDFASTNYEQLALGGSPNCIYHFYYESGSFHKSDGTPTVNMQQLPITGEDELTVITHDKDVNLWDIARGSDGLPVVSWVKFEDYNSRHIAVVAKWTGSEWAASSVSELGGPVSNNPGREWYSGGLCLNKTNPEEIFLSIQGGYGQFGLSKWQRSETSWVRKRHYQGDLARKNFRPVSPINADIDNAEVLWVAGAYQDLQDYGPTSIMISPGVIEFSARPTGLRGALLTCTVAQTIEVGATDIYLQKAVYDTDRFFASAGAFRVPPGVQAVRIGVSIRFSASQADAFVNIVKNGQTHPGMAYAWGSGRILTATSAALLVEPGDEFKCRVQASGATIEAHYATWFSIEVIE